MSDKVDLKEVKEVTNKLIEKDEIKPTFKGLMESTSISYNKRNKC